MDDELAWFEVAVDILRTVGTAVAAVEDQHLAVVVAVGKMT